jgi:hypothetical protein
MFRADKIAPIRGLKRKDEAPAQATLKPHGKNVASSHMSQFLSLILDNPVLVLYTSALN